MRHLRSKRFIPLPMVPPWLTLYLLPSNTNMYQKKWILKSSPLDNYLIRACISALRRVKILSPLSARLSAVHGVPKFWNILFLKICAMKSKILWKNKKIHKYRVSQQQVLKGENLKNSNFEKVQKNRQIDWGPYCLARQFIILLKTGMISSYFNFWTFSWSIFQLE